MENSTPLSDIEIEENVLGALMRYSKALDDVRDLLCEDCFTTTLNRNIYKAIMSLSDKGEPVDILTVVSEMRKQGTFEGVTPYRITELSMKESPNYYYNAQVLLELFSRNKAWETGIRLVKNATDLTLDLTDTVERANGQLSDIFNTPSGGISTMTDAATELWTNHIQRNLGNDNVLTGSPTGFSAFDARSGGLQPGNLIILAAETSQGKSSFALHILANAAKYGHATTIYSMEMNKAELFARMMAGESQISSAKQLYGKLDEEDLVTFDHYLPSLTGKPIYFDDKVSSNIDIIISSIRTMVAKKQIKGVVIDYLQILNVNMKGTNKEQQMGEVARRLKNLARELDIWIIALSQLRRDNTSHIPTMNRLRDSGQIEEAADIVILLYRPEELKIPYPEPFSRYSINGTALVDVAKGRNIGLTKFIVGFDAANTRFYELDSIPECEIADDSPF